MSIEAISNENQFFPELESFHYPRLFTPEEMIDLLSQMMEINGLLYEILDKFSVEEMNDKMKTLLQQLDVKGVHCEAHNISKNQLTILKTQLVFLKKKLEKEMCYACMPQGDKWMWNVSFRLPLTIRF